MLCMIRLNLWFLDDDDNNNNYFLVILIQNKFKQYEENLHLCNKNNTVHMKEMMTINKNKNEGCDTIILF